MLVRRRPPDSDQCIPSWSSTLLLQTLVIFSILLTCSLAQEKKTQCLQKPEVSPKRYLTVEGKPTVMELGVSNSITHQLVTHVLQIYLEEILGYPSISIVKTEVRDLSSVLEKFRGAPRNNITEGIVRWPANYVNLQVWIPPDSNQVVIMEAGEASDVGNIGPPSSYGIYAVNRIDLKKGRIIGPENEIFWQVLTDPSTAVDFRPSQVDVNFIMQSTMLVGGSYYCDENSTIHHEPIRCEYGVYSPPWCKDNNSTCALLVTDYVELSGFLWKEIEGRKLYVQIAWLGGNLESFLDRLHENSTVLLAEATSEPLILLPKPQFKMTKIQLPLCNDYQDHYGCHLYTNRLGKLIPTKFRDWAGPAYETLLKIEFDSKDYKELVGYWMKEREHKGGNEETLLKNAACSWLKQHENASSNSSNFWSVWSTGEEDRRTLQIIGIFPLSKESERYPMAQGIVNGALMAQTAINENKQILRDYNLEIKLQNGQCQADLVLKTFVDIIKNEDFKRVAGILGPACSDTVEPLVAVAKHYKTVVISYSAEGSTFSDRNKYPFFFRTIGENRKYKFVYQKLFNHFKWKRITSLTEDGTKYTEYIAHLETLLHQHGLKFSNKKFPTDWTLETMKQYLENLKNENIRIIIADMNDEAARAVMCEAYKKQMTAADGYVWFLPLWLSDNWYNTTNVTNSTHWSGTKFPCSTLEMEKAINGHFAISHAFFGSDNATMQENITVSEWRESYKQRLARFNSPESNYAGYAYDAVWVYAFALDKLIKKNHSYLANLHEETATGYFVDFIKKTDFYGVSGRINFKGGSSRDSPINVLQWYNRSTKIVGTFTPFDDETSTKDDYGELVMKDDELIWLNEKESVPWDGTPEKQKCLLSSFAHFLNADCETAVVIFSVLGFCILLAIVIIAFIVIKNRYDKKAELTQKIINALGIDLLNESTMSFLDQWEIPRENVVINRRLGEGAFGTVYGGEAFFKEKGWVPVAVKTLKVGSTTEEKLDFLSEAEVMKRFEHKNIVKLLGVCTKNEPIYNVMEFMLYGDLKTFLLARRHMVNNDKLNDDNEEVSSKKLTQMSLDVARALSYLAECKYVHRDVASRNCLINSSRVVKLGDFGMTRPIHENGCYEFNRRGMLPVRWMAPESLGMGIFTHKSDIWSYGVLLFEIITFGSFPFQGMSNNEVLDYVKQGNTISIPEGIKPQLDSLLKQCWKREAKERPDATEIVELIATNQKLLTPCLDVPLKSVIMEDTEQLEISMERGMRRRSGAGFAAALRRASASSLTAATLVGNMVGVTTPDEIHADGSVIPLLSTSPNSIPRYLPLRDMDGPLEYCNHIDNHVDSIL